ncbi:MAG TPA: ABC transporter permease [Actinomycetales bacterium]|nr:ABC transporter permease [Actinomycetales bacterium]
MSLRLTFATAVRVLQQVRHDPRIVALLLVIPCGLIGLLAWVFSGGHVFDVVGAALLGVFPFVVMFLVTSVATLRERQSGTLERLLVMPLGKGDLIGGYALAFGLLAVVQAVLAAAFSVWVLGLDVAGPLWFLVLVAVLDALLGTAFGLLVSAFATTEFQAVQFMPGAVIPQFLVCGLLLPRDQMPRPLELVSDVLPLSYAVDAMRELTTDAHVRADLVVDALVVVGFIVLFIAAAASTLRRRTP